jgi:hypothetical protein
MASTMMASNCVARLPRDSFAKNDVAYLVVERSHEWIILCQSLPLLAKWINTNVSNGEAWDTVSVTGLFDSMGRETGRHGGWHKGRFRISKLSLDEATHVFESMRQNYKNAVMVGYAIGERCR